MTLRIGCALVGLLALALSMSAQTSESSPASVQVPPLIEFSNVATDEGGNSLSGMVSITFSLYNCQRGGEALWKETQANVQLDATGHYSVPLGITTPNGLPTELFTSGEARWLGVQIGEEAEQARVLLLSVPYAIKAGDAETVGGFRPSAFVLAPPGTSYESGTSTPSTTRAQLPASKTPVTTGGGTTNKLAKFDAVADITSSQVFDNGTNVSIGSTTPAAKLDVNGTGIFRGLLTFPSGHTTGTFTAAGSITGASLVSTGSVTASKTVGGAALVSTGPISAGTTVTGASLVSTGTITAGGSVTGDSFVSIPSTGLRATIGGCSSPVVLGGISFGANATCNPSLGSDGTNTYVNAPVSTAQIYITAGAAATTPIAKLKMSSATFCAPLVVNTPSGVGDLFDVNNGTSYAFLKVDRLGNTNITGTLTVGLPLNVIGNVIQLPGSFAVDNSGRVGIGTTAPTNRLTIAQGAGHAIADGWDTYSSRRWKTNIHTLEGALGKITQLRGVSYSRKDSGKREIGVIAEEVGEVVPEVVTLEENGKDARGVDYARLTALLIEATKEQQRLIGKQQEQIQSQRSEMKRQQLQIARLVGEVRTIQAALKTTPSSSHVRKVKTANGD